MRLRAHITLALLIVALAAGCSRPAARPHQTLDERLEPLRAQFNADVDRPRILMIVAPT